MVRIHQGAAGTNTARGERDGEVWEGLDQRSVDLREPVLPVPQGDAPAGYSPRSFGLMGADDDDSKNFRESMS